jgi:hypothetical protein
MVNEPPTAPMKHAFQAALIVQISNLSLKHGRRIPWTGWTRTQAV